MKFLVYFVTVLVPAANSLAQAPIPDTSKTAVPNASIAADTNYITIRGRRGDCYYYIDGIKVRGSANLPKKSIEEVTVITGGVPVDYGDLKGSIIRISKTPAPETSRKTMNKVENMATE